MAETKSLTIEAVEALNKLRNGSMMYVLSLLLIYTGLISLVLLLPGISASIFNTGYYNYNTYYGSLRRYMTEVYTYLVFDVLLIIGGIVMFLVSVLGLLVSGCDGLAKWDSSFRTGARLFHSIRTGILLIIAGFILLLIGMASPVAMGILLIIMSVLSIIVFINKDVRKQINIISAIPEVFVIFFAIVFMIYGILGVVFHESMVSVLTGVFIIILIGMIITIIATAGLSIVYLQLGRTFKSMAMTLAGALVLVPLLGIAAFIIASMEIQEIVSSYSQPLQV